MEGVDTPWTPASWLWAHKGEVGYIEGDVRRTGWATGATLTRWQATTQRPVVRPHVKQRHTTPWASAGAVAAAVASEAA